MYNCFYFSETYTFFVILFLVQRDFACRNRIKEIAKKNFSWWAICSFDKIFRLELPLVP
jgi:hypothetical protein